MTKKKVRRIFLSLHRRKKYKPATSKSPGQPTYHVEHRWKTPCVTPRNTPSKTPSITPSKGSAKRLLTPNSSHKKRKKKIKTFVSPLKLIDEGENESIFYDEMEEEITEEAKAFIDIASDSDVLEEISKAGYLNYFTEFFQLVKQKKYPLSNIAFLLWLETVRWFSCATASHMWYWNKTKKFWRAGYRLFHGKFLTFMAGPRYTSLTVNKGMTHEALIPSISEINFAVPSRSAIIKNNDSPVPSLITPGVIHETLQAVSLSSLSKVNMMCVDGKKVNPGLDSKEGDVNMFGFENSPTVEESSQRLSTEIELVQDMKESLQYMDSIPDESVTNDQLFSFVEMVRALVFLLTVRLKEGRTLKSKQEYGLEKLKERAGPDWKKSKYLFAISGVQAFLFRVKQFLDKTLNNISNLCKLGSAMNMKSFQYCSGEYLDPSTQNNLFLLKEIDKQSQPIPTNLIKQRSDMWHTIRKLAPVTGSSLHNAIGLRSLKEQKSHFDQKVLGLEAPPRSELVQKYLDHGTKNEPNAIATIVGRYLPLFYPDLNFFEEGCYLLNGQSGKTLIEVSPDGSLRRLSEYLQEDKSDGATRNDYELVAAVEVKCPYPKSNGNNPYYDIPDYYICQCLAEMKSLNVLKLLFVCYTDESSTFFEIDFDDSLWNTLEHEADGLYGEEKRVRPTKLKPAIKGLKEKIQIFKSTHVRLLAELPSVKMTENVFFVQDDGSPYYTTTKRHVQGKELTTILNDMQVTMNESEECIRTGHQLCRRKATEVMVWVISNKDRHWSQDLPNSVPVAYGLKDYKFTSNMLREASNYVLEECVKYGLRVPLLAFDGQWYNLMVRDENHKPLTKLQLQKDVWAKVSKMKKNEIVETLKTINKVKINSQEEENEGINLKKDSNGLIVVSRDHAFQTIQTNCNKKHWKKNEIQDMHIGVLNSANESPINESVYEWVPANIIEAIQSSGDKDLIGAINGVSKDIDQLVKTNRDSLAAEDTEVVLNPPNSAVLSEEQEMIISENVAEMQISVLFGNEDDDNMDESESMETESEERIVDEINQTDQQTENFSALSQEASTRQQNEDIEITAAKEIQNCDLESILSKLINSKRGEKWKQTSLASLQESLKNAKSLSLFTKAELDIVANILRENTEFEYGKNWTKDKKINALSQIIGDGSIIQPKKRFRMHKVSSLQNLTVKVLKSKKLPKTVLNIAYSQYLFPTYLDKWQSTSPVCSTIHIGNQELEMDWYSHPEISPATGEILCKCLDSHHLLTNLRVKTCTTGLQGISPDAWKRVANSYKTKLTPALVEDIVDKQSNAFAQTHFSEAVEREMIQNGDLNEGNFCKLIRKWYEAEDAAAIDVSERLSRWLALKEYLLDNVDFGTFPPAGQFIKGLSTVSFEGFLCGIDTKIQLYGQCGPYCVRTASSLPAETCVGGIQDLNINNTMTVNAKDIPRIMSSLTEIMTYKCDPNR